MIDTRHLLALMHVCGLGATPDDAEFIGHMLEVGKPPSITWDAERELWVLEDGSTYTRLIDAENAVTRPKEKP